MAPGAQLGDRSSIPSSSHRGRRVIAGQSHFFNRHNCKSGPDGPALQNDKLHKKPPKTSAARIAICHTRHNFLNGQDAQFRFVNWMTGITQHAQYVFLWRSKRYLSYSLIFPQLEYASPSLNWTSSRDCHAHGVWLHRNWFQAAGSER